MIIIGMLLGSRETSAQRIFGGFLEIGVDCCVNTKTFIHGPVPADGLDDFLPDVIDSVALSLRVLPIAHHEIFCLCGRIFRAVDKLQVAHAPKHVIARLARCGPICPG